MAADMNKNRKEALDTAIAQIEKAYGKGAVMKLGQNTTMQVEAVSTGSLSLDLALGVGGLPRGRVVEIYGPESSGKTTLALHAVAEAQKLGGEAAFIDVEHALDPVYAAANRRWRSPKRWCAAVPSTSSSSTRWPPWCPRQRSRAKWATATWACRPV